VIARAKIKAAKSRTTAAVRGNGAGTAAVSEKISNLEAGLDLRAKASRPERS